MTAPQKLGRAAFRAFDRLGLVFGLVLLIGIVPLALLLWQVAETGRSGQKDEAAARLLQAARFATAVQSEAIATIGQTLSLLASSPLDWAIDEQRCAERVREIADSHPFMAGLAVIRQNGDAICTQAGPGRGLNLGDRDYVRRAMRGTRLHVGAPVTSRASGQVVVPMALRLPAPPAAIDDNPPAVLGATLDLAYIARMLSGSQKIGDVQDALRVKVFSASGDSLVNFPEDGLRLHGLEHPLNQAVVAAQEGTAEMVGHDGLRRIFGFAHAGEAETIYAVTVRSDAVTSRADGRFYAVIASAAVASFAGLGLALLIARHRILRPMRLLTETARRVQKGDAACLPTERLPPEFALLREAMAGMLDAVDSRERALQHANRDLSRLAACDALTGIANRRAFDAEMKDRWEIAQRRGTSVALALLDIDHFKKFNDRYGHPAGDECLCKVAEVLASIGIRDSDLAARIGGEEFALLLPGTETDGAAAVAERVLEALQARRILHEDNLPGIVTASIGVASCTPVPGMESRALVAAADAALYAAKARGRNRLATAAMLAEAEA
ncbi:sensor domain-containing diguanylate cyclase [Elioraea rosea]|uniref:sensor domain-containing diguanylate cyclase n=1 Tax=Elioraea rosea TaxID=2492390 RepID=UPI00118379C7|nr:diguanylate cyclase [Elioraea rosea]